MPCPSGRHAEAPPRRPFRASFAPPKDTLCDSLSPGLNLCDSQPPFPFSSHQERTACPRLPAPCPEGAVSCGVSTWPGAFHTGHTRCQDSCYHWDGHCFQAFLADQNRECVFPGVRTIFSIQIQVNRHLFNSILISPFCHTKISGSLGRQRQ